MTLAHEQYVASRFDAVASRFHEDADRDDYRLQGCLKALGDPSGLRILDLGCGKGRFARHLKRIGADVVGLDPSSGMLAAAGGLDRVKASATRLPFGSNQFDAVIAIEVLEHLSPQGMLAAIDEVVRVLKPGGRITIVDKNLYAMDARRPWLPKLAVKWLDEHRGLWMYPNGGPVRERWFRPLGLATHLRTVFDHVVVAHLLSPEESRRAIFRQVPITRLMTLWTARAPGGPYA